jgi:hypothetical protein
MKMKTNFKMKEATNKEEAITSIENVLIENPLWLNKCTSDLFAVVKQCWDLPMIVKEDVDDRLYEKVSKEMLYENYDSYHDYVDAVHKETDKRAEHRVSMLDLLAKEQIINLFVEIKTEYYNFLDNTQWS